jgi:hypothetical protein
MSSTCARASKASVPRFPKMERKSTAQSDGTAPRGATTRRGTTNSKASTVSLSFPLLFFFFSLSGYSKSLALKGLRESGSGMETMALAASGEKAAVFVVVVVVVKRGRKGRERERATSEVD